MKLGDFAGFPTALPAKDPNTIHLDAKQLPDGRNWRPGARYRVVIDVEVAGASFGGTNEGVDLRVLSARPQYGGGKVKQATSGKPDKSATMRALQRKAG